MLAIDMAKWQAERLARGREDSFVLVLKKKINSDNRVVAWRDVCRPVEYGSHLPMKPSRHSMQT